MIWCVDTRCLRKRSFMAWFEMWRRRVADWVLIKLGCGSKLCGKYNAIIGERV